MATSEPRSKGGFALSDYVEVKDRIRMFYEAHPDGRLVTDRAEYWLEIDPPRVVVKALAYRTADDPHPGVGWSWLELPGKTSYTRGSELENAETSAWGRAIGALGIGIDRSIASKNEVDAKQDDGKPEPEPTVQTVEGGLIGIASLGKASPVDGQMRDTPQGPIVGFVMGDGKDKVQVVAYGQLAEALHPLLETFMGERVQVYGPVALETMRVGNYDRRFPRLTLIQIKTSDFTLPAPVAIGQVAAFDEPITDEEAAAILEREKAEVSR